MSGRRGPLMIPVENQVRELDAKLLLASIAVQRGLVCVVGAKQALQLHAGSLPRGLYLAKSTTARSRRIFETLRRLGHAIAAWDEEALVTFSDPEVYYGRRLSAEALAYPSHLFAWGDASAERLRKYPELPATPVHVTGNPRGDLLRPELRAYFARDVAAHRRRLGDFVLVNTNFGQVNAFAPSLRLIASRDPGHPPVLGRAAEGMSAAYALGRAAHKGALFAAFQRLIPALHEALPGRAVVVRPHPSERPDPYRELARRHSRVHVVVDGQSPVPWLLAARALVHTGCTTAVEAFALGTPAVAYRPVRDERYEEALPNALSHEAGTPEQLVALLEPIIAGRMGPPDDPEHRRLLAHHLAACEGPLACHRILDLCERILEALPATSRPSPGERLSGRVRLAGRRVRKSLEPALRRASRPPALRRQRYPGIDLHGLHERLARWQEVLGHAHPPRVRALAPQVFQLDPPG